MNDVKKMVIRPKTEKYVKTKTGLNCGDAVAAALNGLTLEQVYAVGAQCLGASVEDLLAKYAHLNPGQQRMTLGNRVRKAAGAEGFDMAGFTTTTDTMRAGNAEAKAAQAQAKEAAKAEAKAAKEAAKEAAKAEKAAEPKPEKAAKGGKNGSRKAA